MAKNTAATKAIGTKKPPLRILNRTRLTIQLGSDIHQTRPESKRYLTIQLGRDIQQTRSESKRQVLHSLQWSFPFDDLVTICID
ncbi:hypothetical protein HanHA89_Chr01g0012021 [Helianthus annuus]|nr:hypothetical protein HanHA89_Chr01g0012021 [Helianthus annuus]